MSLRPLLCLCSNHKRIGEIVKRVNRDLVSRVVVSTSEPEREFAEAKASGEPIVLGIFDPLGVRALRFLCDDLHKPASARRVRWVHSYRIGIDVFDLRDLADALGDTPFTISKGDSAPYLAAHVLYSALYFCRQTVKLQRDRAARVWDGATPSDSILGRCVLIFGYGDIGREVARVMTPLRVRLIGVKRSSGSNGSSSNGSAHLPVDDLGVRIVCAQDDVDAALREADYVVNILPATPRTARLFDKDMFAKMKSTAVYINIGRGSTQNEDDLVQALRAGTLRGAALDVCEVEPLPATSPLWTLDDDQLLLTPHTACVTPSWHNLTTDAFNKHLETFVATGRIEAYRPNLREGY